MASPTANTAPSAGTIITAQTVIPAKGHTEVIDPGVEPTFTENGLTEGKHCSVCGEILVAQTVIPAKGHTVVIDPGVEPTCTQSGLTDGKHCSVCGTVIIAQTVIPAKRHTIVTDPRVEPTCVDTGLFQGSHCSVCGTIIIAQTTIPATGKHTYGPDGYCTICRAEKPKPNPTEGLEYTLNSDKVSYSVTGIGTVTATDIVIPDTYNGLPVTGVGYRAFYECSSLTSITIPDSVTSISNAAFSRCSSLTSITIPDSVTSIDGSAFSDCSSLTSITIPNSVTSIVDWTFYGCSSLTSITIPNGVTSIGTYAFQSCSSLTSITIPNGVTSISYAAFRRCSNLTSITIPGSVTIIEAGAFEGCSSLTSITVSPDNPIYHSSGNCLIETATKTLIAGCQNSIIPADGSVTSIGDWAFIGHSSLTSITIPNSVTSIGDTAFAWCTSLTSITIPDSVTSIGDTAFAWCTSLTSITIPDSVTSIGYGVFYQCSSLTSITIPDSVTSIGSYAFEGCSSLTSITFQGTTAQWNAIEKGSGWDNQTPSYTIHCTDGTIAKDGTITPNTPAYSTGLLFTSNGDGTCYVSGIGTCTDTEVVIPSVSPAGDEVTSIGDYAFSYCSSLTSITIPDSVTSIGNEAFYYCSNLTSITIPDSVSSIGDYAFSWCSSLTSVTIPDSVTSIGGWAFYYCSSLTSIIVSPDNPIYHSSGNCLIETATKTLIAGCQNSIIPTDGSVTSIGDYAFQGCSSLTSITIPDSVTSIGYHAFYKCSSLTSITFQGTTAQWTAIEKVYGWNSNTGSYTIHCTDGTIAKDGTITPYSQGLTFTLNDDGASYALTNVFTDVGNGAFREHDTHLRIPPVYNGLPVTSIASSACLEGLDSGTCYRIDIPHTVTCIEKGAFQCRGLVSVYYNGTMDEWNSWYTGGITNMPKYTIEPYKIHCTDDTYWEGGIPLSYTPSIYEGHTAQLTQNLKMYGFGYTLPSTLYISPVYMGKPITHIAVGGFQDCNVHTLYLPNSIQTIGDGAFAYSALTAVYYNGTIAEWNAIEKGTYWDGGSSYTIHCTDGTITK